MEELVNVFYLVHFFSTVFTELCPIERLNNENRKSPKENKFIKSPVEMLKAKGKTEKSKTKFTIPLSRLGVPFSRRLFQEKDIWAYMSERMLLEMTLH